MSEHTDEHEEHEVHTSLAGYFMVFGALMVFTVLTVVVAKAPVLHLPGYGNITVAMAIAVTKATLVLYFFMHLRESAQIVKYVAILGFLTLGLLLTFALSDIKGRDLTPYPQGFTEIDYQ